MKFENFFSLSSIYINEFINCDSPSYIKYFEGFHLGVEEHLRDPLRTLHLQLLGFFNVEEAFIIIIWYSTEVNADLGIKEMLDQKVTVKMLQILKRTNSLICLVMIHIFKKITNLLSEKK